MTLDELQKFVLENNSKLMKQYIHKRPPPELAKKISDCFFDIADSFNRQLPDIVKRHALIKLHRLIIDYDQTRSRQIN